MHANKVSRINMSIFDIKIPTIAFTSIFSRFASSIMINDSILFFQEMAFFMLNFPESLFGSAIFSPKCPVSLNFFTQMHLCMGPQNRYT